MFNFAKHKKGEKICSPQEFLVQSISFLHNKAKSKGYANKGFILNEGLLKIGNPIIHEALKSSPNVSNRPEYFYYETATSVLQIGMILGRQAGIDARSLSDGSFFDSHEDLHSMYNELLIVLNCDLHRSIQDWNDFRYYIVSYWNELIDRYRKCKNFEEYNGKLLASYYMLGVSIGTEKYESRTV